MIDLNNTYKTLMSRELTHEQRLMGLAKCAENALDVLNIPPRTKYFFGTGAVNNLFGGGAPCRPRYILSDYEKFVEQGSEFLKPSPPKTLDELIFSLMILYRHVPSVTNFSVYLGSLGKMMKPYLDGHTDEEIREKLRLFLTYLDHAITGSFCHASLGPEGTRAGCLILQMEAELKNTVPNFTIKYNPVVTPDSFMEQAIQYSLDCSNPAICNHAANQVSFGNQYGIASCYNVLPTQDGAYTLTRVTLTELVKEAKNGEHFLNELLPECLGLIADYMNERIRFIVEESDFSESNFLAKEELLSKDRFLGMFGVTGLAECVNALLREQGKKCGQSPEANDLGVQVMNRINELVSQYRALYSPVYGDQFLLHAQVGLDSDQGITSGVRTPIGDEPVSFADHLRHSSKFHHYFPTGVDDILPIASNVHQNPAALLDVVKGVFSLGVQYMSFYSADTDLIRIIGFLIKRSEMEKYRKHEAVLQNTTQLDAPNYDENHLTEGKVRMA